MALNAMIFNLLEIFTAIHLKIITTGTSAVWHVELDEERENNRKESTNQLRTQAKAVVARLMHFIHSVWTFVRTLVTK